VYRFLLSSRWLGLLALAVVAAVACVLLGSWQWDRREQRLARNAEVVGNYDRDPVPLEQALPDLGRFPEGATWTPVEVEGEYVEDATVLVRNRTRDGRPGYQVLVPLRSADGPVLVVDRGFLPVGQTGEGPDEVPAPPSGEVTVVARLRAPEPTDQRGAPAGQAQRINPAALAAALAESSGGRFEASDVVTGAYADVAAEDPRPAQAPAPEPRPALDEGPHLSYALQWVVFGIGALVGFVVLARRTAQDDAEELAARPERADPQRPSGRPAGHAPQRARRGRPSAEDEEDALLDAAERQAAGGPQGGRPADRV
jgi:cytochrome oxidase assembly protein ShyY1